MLAEVEPSWWILASVDLTRLHAPAATRGQGDKDTGVEYSSKEVASPQLLLSQLTRAHRGFLLHHAASLTELWTRLAGNRETFCGLLDRYWSRWIENWDVLLHGNPAVEVYNGVKLAGGGELGVGVGEEEWGSGEREVLEGFVVRTDGLVDLMVGRYGDGPVEPVMGSPDEKQTSAPKTQSMATEPEPWLGRGEDARAEDGLIFSGVGAISRTSLATVSHWMEAIFKHGDAAYGVGQDPSSRPRYRQRSKKVKGSESGPAWSKDKQQLPQQEVRPRFKSPRGRAPNLRRKAIENSAAPPGIPAPLVGAVERSLDEAIAKVKSREASGSPRRGKNENEAMEPAEPPDHASPFGTEKIFKYLSLGYGSSWTLNPRGFSVPKEDRVPSEEGGGDGGGSGSSDNHKDGSGHGDSSETNTTKDPSQGHLQLLDPTPEVSDEEERPFVQRLEQSMGKFLIGFSGDLENTEFEPDLDDNPTSLDPDVDSSRSQKPHRIFLRTVTVELSRAHISGVLDRRPRSVSHASEDSTANAQGEGKTGATASVDGAQPYTTHEKLQIAVYVHQPFIFVFLFHLHTPSLTRPGFYRGIHHTLGPLQRSLLRSTDPVKARERMVDALQTRVSTAAGWGDEEHHHRQQHSLGMGIYDLIYDPVKLSVRTSIPNIPMPGSLAAEGLMQRQAQHARAVTVSGSWYTLGIPIGSGFNWSGSSTHAGGDGGNGLMKSEWTRVEALNVHSQILNMWTSTRTSGELERTVKTGRGWWVVWLRVEDGDKKIVLEDHGERDERAEAFLVRRTWGPKRDGLAGRSSSGKWLLREQPRSARDGSGSGATGAKSVSEGVGVDARKWVEGLLKLSQ